MAKLPIQPIGGRILVMPEAEAKETPSGLIISTNSKGEKPQIGSIVALGEGKKDKDGKLVAFSSHLKVGAKVAFKKYSPDEFEFDGETYLIMDEDAILGVIPA
jgi:chaperonin GroES